MLRRELLSVFQSIWPAEIGKQVLGGENTTVNERGAKEKCRKLKNC